MCIRDSHCAGKQNDWQRIRLPAGHLPNSVKYILVDEDTVPRFQNRVVLSYLEVQDTALRCGDLEVWMPMHRSRAVWQICEFIRIKCNGKIQNVTRYLLLQLMIN